MSAWVFELIYHGIDVLFALLLFVGIKTFIEWRKERG